MTLISSQKPRNSSKNSQIKLTEIANGMASRSMVTKTMMAVGQQRVDMEIKLEVKNYSKWMNSHILGVS